MKLNWQELRKKQAQLDEPIMINAGLKEHEVIDKRILSLLVELGELANELPEVFKYWSNKKNNYSAALVEYVDVLHFILSIENYYDFKDINIGSIRQYDEVVQFTVMNHNIAGITIDEKHRDAKLTSIRGHFIGLGEMLGFSNDEINDAYNRKYEVNLQRQANGY